MRPYPDYKKQFKALVFLTMLVATAAVFSSLVPFATSYAQTADDIRDRIEEKDAEIRKLEREISAFQKEIDTLNKQKSTLSGEIKELDLTKKKLNADIKVTENKIAKTNLKIEDLGLDIGDKETSIRNNDASIRLGIKTMNELEEKSLVEVILSDEDYGEIWTDLDNMITVRENLRKNIISLKETKIVLEDTRAETIKAKNELTKLKSQLADQQKIVIQNTNEKNKLLKQTQNNEANYQKLLQDRVAQRDAFEKELENYEAQLSYILDPSKLPAGRVLSWRNWPASPRVAICIGRRQNDHQGLRGLWGKGLLYSRVAGQRLPRRAKISAALRRFSGQKLTLPCGFPCWCVKINI